MKKVSKISVRDQAEVLTREEMKLILGRGTYYCRCGISNPSGWYKVTASNMNSALLAMADVCYNNIYGGVGTCGTNV